jgi:hypothetical protein
MHRISLLVVLTTLTGNVASQQGERNNKPTSRPKAVKAPWTPLFDGKTLNGWTVRNGFATYEVEDGAILGRTKKGSPNSYLCTNRDYSDFELWFDIKMSTRLNSGCQIRSQTRGSRTGHVNGPQIEIVATGRGGGIGGYIYGEGLGGWMTPEDKRASHEHFKNDKWNSYRVLANGANIKVWLNDVMVSDLTHEARYASHPRGFIGLQMHSGGNRSEALEARWRNIVIREIRDKKAGWTKLYNGKNLDGWTTEGNWIPSEGGVLRIEPRKGERGWKRFASYLWTKKKYKDFILDLEYSYPTKGNSGVFFRVGDIKSPVTTGIEAQILDSTGKKKGKMTPHDHGGIISTVGATKNMSRPAGVWNRMIVTCRGHHLMVDLNGEQIIDVKLDKSAIKDRPPEGHIGLQDHGKPNVIRFRNIWLKEL